MSENTACENPNKDVADDLEVPIILSGAVTGSEFVLLFRDDGEGGLEPEKITAAEFKTYINT